ncbi:MAG TPA: YlxR family protein [Deltaproteobacteria bacterium]|nr:YlxR family protein [Deltaproteobacteria bacterium]HIJ36136.1 YlxR family protein [Deltaproteobacteria bacterium]HIJ42156.1 YlxR family protein [Deltaproteobacteria bacterium]
MAEKKGHLPVRTCICCRSKKEKKSLIRLVLSNEQVVTRDDHGNGKGRGAYVCPEKACIEGLLDAGRLNRAFKMKGRFSVHQDLSQYQGFILDG